MQYVRASHINEESKEIPEGTIFTVYTEDQKCAFAMRINGEITLSQYMDKNANKKQVQKAWNQINYAKKNGWSGTNQTALDDVDWKQKKVFHCLYCNTQTIEPDGPCECRAKPKSPFLSDLLLPSDW